MYEARVVHVLATGLLGPPTEVADPLWELFLAIGAQWRLDDDPDPYRSRLRVFMDNRVAINPLYGRYYDVAIAVIEELVAKHGKPKAFEVLFAAKVPSDGPPSTPIEATKRYVVNEFITMRLAVGGFQTFGARNYNGWPSGTNNPDEPVPYREMGDIA